MSETKYADYSENVRNLLLQLDLICEQLEELRLTKAEDLA